MNIKRSILDETITYRLLWSFLNDFLPYIPIFGTYLLILEKYLDRSLLVLVLVMHLGALSYLFISFSKFNYTKIVGSLFAPFIVLLGWTIQNNESQEILLPFLGIIFGYSIIDGIISEYADVQEELPKSTSSILETMNRLFWSLIIAIFIISLINTATVPLTFNIVGSSVGALELYLFTNLLSFLIIHVLSTYLLLWRNEHLELISKRLKTISSWNIEEKTIEEDLLKNRSLELKHQYRTIMFGDVRGFTKFSEQNDIKQVVIILHNLYAIVEDTVLHYGGFKPEYIADEFITFFDDTKACIDCALELNKKLYYFLYPFGLSFGIGIDRGDVIEGIVGSKSSKKYTAFGRAVNTAARLQSNAKGGQILISRKVFNEVPNLAVERVTGITLKGVRPNFEIYKVFGYQEYNLGRNSLWEKLKSFFTPLKKRI